MTRAGTPVPGAGRAEGEWHVDRIGYCFPDSLARVRARTRARIPLLMDGQICILMPERSSHQLKP